MAKNTHLTLNERITIQSLISDGANFTAIGVELGKDPSTISKEIRNHYKVEEKASFNPCMHRKGCKHHSDLCQTCRHRWGKGCPRCDYEKCHTICPDFKELVCLKLKKPPYVCNGCNERHRCKLRRHLYDAKYAQAEYESVRSESRKGFAITSDELVRIDGIISPLVKQGQSIHQICVNNGDSIMLDEKTIYNYIDAGLLSVGNIDLPRKVRYRVRKKKKPVKVDKQCHKGRTYDDFLEYIEANPDIAVVEMDSVEGRKGGKVFMTMYFRNCSLMLTFIRDANTARTITDKINYLHETLGHDTFVKLFPVIITDRGSEFTDPLSIEFTNNKVRRTHVFYCDPQRSDQKGGIEVTHEFIRRFLPKGTSFDNLDQSDVSLIDDEPYQFIQKKKAGQPVRQPVVQPFQWWRYLTYA